MDDWRLRALRAESELEKWTAPHEDQALEDLRSQAMSGYLAPQRAYINGLECFYRQARAEVERLREAVKSARDWMIGVNQGARAVGSGTSRVLDDLNTALAPQGDGDDEG